MPIFLVLLGLVVVGAIAFYIHDFQRSSSNSKGYTKIECRDLVDFSTSSYKKFFNPELYCPQHEIDHWKVENSDKFPIRIKSLQRDCEHYGIGEPYLLDAFQFITDPQAAMKLHNEAFIYSRIQKHSNFFSTLQAHELTLNQKEAVVVDETNTLVIAGAGTGKTATAVSKIVYLLKFGIVKPDEILILAYNRKAADEFEAKLVLKGVSVNSKKEVETSDTKGVTARTFHALGKEIIGKATGKSPSLSKLAEDDRNLSGFIDEFLIESFLSNEHSRPLINFCTDQLEESPSLSAAETGDEYIKASKDLDLQCINGVYLKSREELCIANYLTLNALNWEYERPYPHNTATSKKQQYKPDFYLTDYDIYLEHFGVDAEGNTRPGIDAKAYGKEMLWKRELHNKYSTRLIETYSAMRISGEGLTVNLDRLFTENGIKTRNLTRSELLALNDQGSTTFKDLSKIFKSYLNLYKTNNYNNTHNKPKPQNTRDKCFLKIFNRFLDAYEDDLAKNKSIDFFDQINLATSYAKQGKYNSRFKYIIVDEFQDASISRLELVKALREQHWDSRVFAVGDDWQSIYRFAGSDINVMTNFEEEMGMTRKIQLDTTFRFNQQLAKVSSRFVQQNPAQLKKSIKSISTTSRKVLSIYGIGKERDAPRGGELWDALNEITQDIAKVSNNVGTTIKVLGRYNFSEPEWLHSISKQSLEFESVHRSKGLEADYVIVLGLNIGRMGFPSQITDDSVLSMVLSEPDSFEHSEERRLFYVAMTRAREKVFLIHEVNNSSPFVSEILSDPWYAQYISIDGKTSAANLICPKCKGNTIVEKRGQWGSFLACSNYPLCDCTVAYCDQCQVGGVLQIDGLWQCSSCQKIYDDCRSNDCTGHYIKKEGRFGDFLGCSNYPKCSSTSNIS